MPIELNMKTSNEMSDPFVWFCLRVGDWKFENGRFYRYRRTTARKGSASWMRWERVYIFGPPPEEA
jgi:hypothetical protein